MKNEKLIIWAFLSIPFLAGCSSITSDNLHYIDRSLSYTKDETDILVYKSTDFSPDNIDAVILHPVMVVVSNSEKNLIVSEETAVKFASDFESELIADIRKETRLNVLRPGAAIPAAAKTADIKMFVTELDPGSGFARWFLGAGAGATKVQLEGEIRDFSGSLTMAFASRKLHSGNPTLGLNVSSLSDDFTFKELREEFVKTIVKLLQ